MRVNILTQPLFCNYGGILQNYALQTVLRRLGHEPLTVNVPTPMPSAGPKWKAGAHTIINGMKRFAGRYDAPFINPWTFARKEHELSFNQRAFIEKHINKVDCPAPFSAEVCSRFPAQAWIVGSDQVWRPWCSHHIENCFFDFIPADSGIKRVAYSASFGTDKWEPDETLTSRLREHAGRFDAISVRELSGIDLCRKYLGVDAVFMPDPTLLLDPDDYLALTAPSDRPDSGYIATYILDSDREKKNFIKKTSADLDKPVRSVGQMHRDHFDSIESWLATIAGADMVITDSFHGTVFSIIFGCPFRILSNDTRGNARLASLLEITGLTPCADGVYRPDAATRRQIDNLNNKAKAFLKTSLV